MLVVFINSRAKASKITQLLNSIYISDIFTAVTLWSVLAVLIVPGHYTIL